MMKGLSKREVKVIAWLEFNNKYFFEISDIKRFFKKKTQIYDFIKRLVRKKRIIKINRNKYYLVPIKAVRGGWAEHPFIIADEICNSKDYFIGGWSAANYWGLTEQIPFITSVYTTRRQGTVKILSATLEFHRTTKKRVEQRSVVQKIQDHEFRIISKEESRKWLRSRR